jgi:hypothetical protein
MTTEQGRELGWNDPIENDGGDFTLLDPGEYPFTVIKFDRKRYAGGAKLPPCNQAVLTLDIDGSTVESSLFLHSKTEGLLCQFFRSIGARKHGERVVMDWGKVPGATGRCKVGHRTWTGKDGKEHQSNQVEKFLDPVEAPATTPAPEDNLPF